jgi:uncharacterized protein (TIRG00374 family)
MPLNGSMRRNLVVALGLLISAAALWLVVRSIDLSATMQVLVRAAPAPLFGIVGIVAVQVMIRALRWSILLPVEDGQRRVPPTRLVPPLLAGQLGNAVLPARLGEPIRALIASRRERIGFTESLGSVLLERLIDVATLAPIALLAAILVGAPSWAIQVASVVAIGSGAVVVLLATSGVGPLIRLADRFGLGRREAVRSLAARFASTVGGAHRRGAILVAVAISSASWLLDGASFWLAAQALGLDVGYAGALLISGITVLGTAVPSAPGYVGTFELAAASVAGALGVSGEAALALAVIAHVMTLGPMALGGAVSMMIIGASLGEVAHAAESAGSG